MTTRTFRFCSALLAAGILMLGGAASAEAAGLRAGVGKADITPRTGYYLGGWTRADRVAQGQHSRLASRPFRVVPARTLAVRRVEAGVTLDYPAAVRDRDLRHRPASASGGVVRYRRGNRTVTVRQRRGTVFPVPAGATDVRGSDRFGNRALTSSTP